MDKRNEKKNLSCYLTFKNDYSLNRNWEESQKGHNSIAQVMYYYKKSNQYMYIVLPHEN